MSILALALAFVAGAVVGVFGFLAYVALTITVNW